MSRYFLLACLVGLILTACDTSIEPVREETFSVYGYLSLTSEKQFVRVNPLDQVQGEREGSALEGVRVTLRNESDGESYVLQDSVVVFVDNGDSVYTHNYWTDASIMPSTEYKLLVEREDEVVTTASTATPTNSTPSVSPDSGNCRTGFYIQFENAGQLPIRIFGSFEYNGGRSTISLDNDSLAVARNPEDDDPFVIIEPENNLLDKRIPKKEQPDTGGMFDDRYVPRCLDLDDSILEFRYILSRDWQVRPPDSSALAGPIRFVENPRIENGHGFFGSLGGGKVSVEVDTADTLGSRGPPGSSSSVSEATDSCLPPCSP